MKKSAVLFQIDGHSLVFVGHIDSAAEILHRINAALQKNPNVIGEFYDAIEDRILSAEHRGWKTSPFKNDLDFLLETATYYACEGVPVDEMTVLDETMVRFSDAHVLVVIRQDDGGMPQWIAIDGYTQVRPSPFDDMAMEWGGLRHAPNTETSYSSDEFVYSLSGYQDASIEDIYYVEPLPLAA